MQFLALIEYHILNTYWGAEVQPQAFLISELGGVQWSPAICDRFQHPHLNPTPETPKKLNV